MTHPDGDHADESPALEPVSIGDVPLPPRAPADADAGGAEAPGADRAEATIDGESLAMARGADLLVAEIIDPVAAQTDEPTPSVKLAIPAGDELPSPQNDTPARVAIDPADENDDSYYARAFAGTDNADSAGAGAGEYTDPSSVVLPPDGPTPFIDEAEENVRGPVPATAVAEPKFAGAARGLPDFDPVAGVQDVADVEAFEPAFDGEAVSSYAAPSHVVMPMDDGLPHDARDDGDDAAGPLGYESAAEPVAAASTAPAGGGWTIPFLCAGIGLIACCLVIPLADANRRLAYDREQLRQDLSHLQEQSLVNDEFIRKINDDPTLAERLAQRQMKTVRAGTKVLELPRSGRAANAADDVSPFQIVAIDPPAPAAPYRPLGGRLASLCYAARTRLYVMGAGLLLLAAGLVLGYAPRREAQA